MFQWLLLFYYLLVIAGASLFIGQQLIRHLLKKSLDQSTRLIMGFTVMPIFIAWLGYLQLGQMSYLTQVMAFSAFAYLILNVIHHRQQYLQQLQHAGILFLPIAIMVVLLLFCKHCYLDGAINNLDDLRSVALTGSLASNALKPAFVTDFSIPLSYSYYLYEWSAFLYASVSGVGMPSIAVLAINLYVIVFFYLGLYLIGKSLFPDFNRQWFWLLSALLTFYGLDFSFPQVWKNQHLEWWNKHQITQMASYFHWTYQYLFSAILLLLALIHLFKFSDKQQKQDGLLFVIFHTSAAGFGAITFVWSSIALLPVFIHILIAKRTTLLLKNIRHLIVPSLLIILFIFLPVLPAYVGREVILSFNIVPHWWFDSPESSTMQTLLHNLKITFYEIGPLLMIGLFLIPFAGKKLAKTHHFQYLSIYGIALLLLSIFSSSPYFDWFSRGILLVTLLSGLFASAFLQHRLFLRKTSWGLYLLLLLLAPQLFNFLLENNFRRKTCLIHQETSVAIKINQLFPLTSIIKPTDPILNNAILLSGRALIDKPDARFLSTYRNKPTFLKEQLNWNDKDLICRESFFGKTVNDNFYIEIKADAFKIKYCDNKIK